MISSTRKHSLQLTLQLFPKSVESSKNLRLQLRLQPSSLPRLVPILPYSRSCAGNHPPKTSPGPNIRIGDGTSNAAKQAKSINVLILLNQQARVKENDKYGIFWYVVFTTKSAQQTVDECPLPLLTCDHPCFSMACFKRFTTISTGTSFPSCVRAIRNIRGIKESGFGSVGEGTWWWNMKITSTKY